MHADDDEWPVRPKPPSTPAHEGVGRVAAMGKVVKQVREGERVGVRWLFQHCVARAAHVAGVPDGLGAVGGR